MTTDQTVAYILSHPWDSLFFVFCAVVVLRVAWKQFD